MLRQRSTIVALAMSGFFLALSLRAVQPGEVAGALSRAHYGWVLLAVIVAAAVVLVRALRWWLLLAASGRIGRRHVLSAASIALMVNAVFPFRGVSSLLRSYLVRRHSGVPMVTSIGSITIERFWEVSSQVLTIGVVLLSLDLPGWTVTSGAVLLGVHLLMLAALAGLWLVPHPMVALIQRIAGRLSPRAGEALLAHFAAFRNGLAAFGRPSVLVAVDACTVAIAVGQGLAVWLAMRALSLDVAPLAAWAVYIGVTFGLALPSAPAGIGTFQYVVISILGGLAVSTVDALTASFIIQLALLGPAIAIGLVCLSIEGISLRAVAGRARIRVTFVGAAPTVSGLPAAK